MVRAHISSDDPEQMMLPHLLKLNWTIALNFSATTDAGWLMLLSILQQLKDYYGGGLWDIEYQEQMMLPHLLHRIHFDDALMENPNGSTRLIALYVMSLNKEVRMVREYSRRFM